MEDKYRAAAWHDVVYLRRQVAHDAIAFQRRRPAGGSRRGGLGCIRRALQRDRAGGLAHDTITRLDDRLVADRRNRLLCVVQANLGGLSEVDRQADFPEVHLDLVRASRPPVSCLPSASVADAFSPGWIERTSASLTLVPPSFTSWSAMRPEIEPLGYFALSSNDLGPAATGTGTTRNLAAPFSVFAETVRASNGPELERQLHGVLGLGPDQTNDLHAELLRVVLLGGRDGGNGDRDLRPLQELLHPTDRNGEVDPRAYDAGLDDADHAAVSVQQRAAGVAGV